MSREAVRLFRRIATIDKACRCQSMQVSKQHQRRSFANTTRRKVIKPYLLADIGEGITECQVIQWFVKPGARVEQFDPICEVQSDKASVEITSRFDGVIKKLHYEPDDMAKVGQPLVDIDIQSEISTADAVLLEGSSDRPAVKEKADETAPADQSLEVGRNDTKTIAGYDVSRRESLPSKPSSKQPQEEHVPGKNALLATPAVRHMIKTLNLKIEDIHGTGKDGRVMKNDVQKFVESSQDTATFAVSTSAPRYTPLQSTEDYIKPLTPVQAGMYKQMTRSLSIPHFLYTDAVDFTALNTMRKKYNINRDRQRLTTLPFIVKALSLALQQYPIINAHLDNTTDPAKPQLLIKSSHDIGLAVDSPAGLLVPVIRNVQSHSIESLRDEIARIGDLARNGKLTSADLSGATITLSNIGSIGGTAVAPVIVSPQVAILGIGRARAVPAFGENGEIVRREECVFSWSADHRVIDGATAARCADIVRNYLENVESMLVGLR